MAINDNLNTTPQSCNRLEEIAKEARERLIRDNIYQNQLNKIYGVTHPNATQEKGGIDDRKNNKGKGTGDFLDTSKGGGNYDINGRSDVLGSGRKALLQLNKYTSKNPYDCFQF
jgi:hypothetical protein